MNEIQSQERDAGLQPTPKRGVPESSVRALAMPSLPLARVTSASVVPNAGDKSGRRKVPHRLHRGPDRQLIRTSTRSSCGGCQRRNSQRTLYYRQVPAGRASVQKIPTSRAESETRALSRERRLADRKLAKARRSSCTSDLRICQSCQITCSPGKC